MSAAQYDFSIEQGSSFRLSLVYKDSNGVAIDITNWCARLIWKTNSNLTQTYSSGNADVSNYKFTIDGPNGKLLLEFPATTTNGFDFTSAKLTYYSSFSFLSSSFSERASVILFQMYCHVLRRWPRGLFLIFLMEVWILFQFLILIHNHWKV